MWRPSRNARLTLKQLGLSPAEIEDAVQAYQPVPDEHSDLAFMRFARDHTDSEALRQRAAAVLDLPLDWQPPVTVRDALLAAGYQPEAIADYRDVFVLSAREQGRALREPGRAFLAYCRARPPAREAPLPADWLPRVTDLQCLVRQGLITEDRLTDSIDRFIHHHRGAVSADWDGAFREWLQAGERSTAGVAAP